MSLTKSSFNRTPVLFFVTIALLTLLVVLAGLSALYFKMQTSTDLSLEHAAKIEEVTPYPNPTVAEKSVLFPRFSWTPVPTGQMELQPFAYNIPGKEYVALVPDDFSEDAPIALSVEEYYSSLLREGWIRELYIDGRTLQIKKESPLEKMDGYFLRKGGSYQILIVHSIPQSVPGTGTTQVPTTEFRVFISDPTELNTLLEGAGEVGLDASPQ